ncbi:carbohydrate esterase family 4 protein [Mycena floridula]|nr:carbohydrate esterase family 4 protein [Mycena floridula]
MICTLLRPHFSPKAALFTVFLSASLSFAQDRTSEAGVAAIKDPVQECTNYNYAPVTNNIAQFPPLWTPATIVSTDTVAKNLWNSISPSVPNIAPKGTITGDTTNVTYSSATDPDCWWTRTGCVTPKLTTLKPDIFNVPEPKTLGYGFDDGPNCSHNAFYDYLTEQNQKATMFYIGSSVMIWPLQAQRAVTDGHEICVHTWSHRYMTSFASADAFAELYYTLKAIKLATGVTPTCWRPPFGDVDDRIRAIATGLNLTTIIWKYDSFDWEVGFNGVTADQVDANYQNFINNATSGTFDTVGAIILTHELNNYTMSEAVKWYPQLKAAFNHIVPVGVAMNKTHPYVETNYTLPTFAQYVAGATTSNSSSSSSSSNSSGSQSPGSKQSGNGSVKRITIGNAASFLALVASVALMAQ